EVRRLDGVRAVAQLAAEQQPGRHGVALVAHRVERIGALARLDEEAVVLQPAWQAWALGPLVLQAVRPAEMGQGREQAD
ncbi:hypothetical protein ACPTJ1_31420, partial [Pseudomonas aeruginosa]|uniref:hypothetical protein n=1 Tax=Pseudomonas aeruginosa TaxID=287 RepID=UPI003CC53290